MAIKNFIDVYKQISVWCFEEAESSRDPRERDLWLASGIHWRERAAMAEAKRAAEGSPSDLEPPFEDDDDL